MRMKAKISLDNFSLSLFVTQSILTTLQLVSSLGLTIQLMEHRVWFDSGLSLGLDLTIPLIILIIVSTILIFTKKKQYSILPLLGLILLPILGFALTVSIVSLASFLVGIVSFKNARRTLFWILAALSAVELTAIVYWLVFAPLQIAFPLANLVNLDEVIFFLTSPLSIIVLIAIICASLIAPVRLFWRNKTSIVQSEENIPTSKSRNILLYLSLIIVFTVFSVLYPSLPGINPQNNNVGTDVSQYVSDLGGINNGTLTIFNANDGSRPLFFLVLEAFQRLFGLSNLAVVNLIPILIAPILVISVFFLSREVLQDDAYALWASFFTVAGFHIVVGMYSFFLTDMLGLSFTFLALTLFFRGIRLNDWKQLISSALFMGLLLLTHPWTFIQYAAALAPLIVYLAITSESKQIKTLSRLAIIGAILILGATQLAPQFVGGFDAFKTFTSGITTLDDILPSTYNSQFYYSGLLANLLLLTLAAVGIIITKLRKIPAIFLTSFLFTTTIGYLLVDMDVKKRFLYNYPWGLLAAMGLMVFQKTEDRDLKTIIPIFISLSLIAYQLRSLANIV